MKMATQLSLLVGVIVLCIAVYRLILYPALLSPLAKVPNAHWSSSISSAWLLWLKWSHQENLTVYKRHMESGPVIRLAPNVLSVNCFEDGLKTIYQGGFPKPVFYFRGFAIYQCVPSTDWPMSTTN
jgi:hypothetical protein